jgi:hypothetical protein
MGVFSEECSDFFLLRHESQSNTGSCVTMITNKAPKSVLVVDIDIGSHYQPDLLIQPDLDNQLWDEIVIPQGN